MQVICALRKVIVIMVYQKKRKLSIPFRLYVLHVAVRVIFQKEQISSTLVNSAYTNFRIRLREQHGHVIHPHDVPRSTLMYFVRTNMKLAFHDELDSKTMF